MAGLMFLLASASIILQPFYVYMAVAKRLDLCLRNMKDHFSDGPRIGLHSSSFSNPPIFSNIRPAFRDSSIN